MNQNCRYKSYELDFLYSHIEKNQRKIEFLFVSFEVLELVLARVYQN